MKLDNLFAQHWFLIKSFPIAKMGFCASYWLGQSSEQAVKRRSQNLLFGSLSGCAFLTWFNLLLGQARKFRSQKKGLSFLLGVDKVKPFFFLFVCAAKPEKTP